MRHTHGASIRSLTYEFKKLKLILQLGYRHVTQHLTSPHTQPLAAWHRTLQQFIHAFPLLAAPLGQTATSQNTNPSPINHKISTNLWPEAKIMLQPFTWWERGRLTQKYTVRPRILNRQKSPTSHFTCLCWPIVRLISALSGTDASLCSIVLRNYWSERQLLVTP